MADGGLKRLVGYHPLFVCEGTAEQVIVDKLLKSDVLVFPAEDVLDITRTRKAADIEDGFLSYDYDWPVCIVRVLDSRKEGFRLGKLFSARFPVANVVTHPEVEILAIIREGEWGRWQRSGKRPSDYCKQDLKMRGIKAMTFLERYWDVESITRAAIEYRRVSDIPRHEICLADLIRGA